MEKGGESDESVSEYDFWKFSDEGEAKTKQNKFQMIKIHLALWVFINE